MSRSKARGVLISFTCSTLSYDNGGRISSGAPRLCSPEKAEARLDEFVRVSRHLIAQAKRRDDMERREPSKR